MKERLVASTRKTARILNSSESYKIQDNKISRETVENHQMGQEKLQNSQGHSTITKEHTGPLEICQYR